MLTARTRQPDEWVGFSSSPHILSFSSTSSFPAFPTFNPLQGFFKLRRFNLINNILSFTNDHLRPGPLITLQNRWNLECGGWRPVRLVRGGNLQLWSELQLPPTLLADQQSQLICISDIYLSTWYVYVNRQIQKTTATYLASWAFYLNCPIIKGEENTFGTFQLVNDCVHNINHIVCKIGHPPNRACTTPDIHRIFNKCIFQKIHIPQPCACDEDG